MEAKILNTNWFFSYSQYDTDLQNLEKLIGDVNEEVLTIIGLVKYKNYRN